jgi:hypothetical protein
MSFIYINKDTIITDKILKKFIIEFNEAICITLFNSRNPFFLTYSKHFFTISIEKLNSSTYKLLSLLYYVFFNKTTALVDKVLLESIEESKEKLILNFNYYFHNKTQDIFNVLDFIDKIKKNITYSFGILKNTVFQQFTISNLKLNSFVHTHIKENTDKLKLQINKNTIDYILSNFKNTYYSKYYIVHFRDFSKLIFFIESKQNIITLIDNILVNSFQNGKTLLLYEPIAKIDENQLDTLIRFSIAFKPIEKILYFMIEESIFLFIEKSISNQASNIISLLNLLENKVKALDDLEIPFIITKTDNYLFSDLFNIYLKYNRNKISELLRYNGKYSVITQCTYNKYTLNTIIEKSIYYIPFFYIGKYDDVVIKKWLDIQEEWNSFLINFNNYSIFKINRKYDIPIRNIRYIDEVRYLIKEALETCNIIYDNIYLNQTNYIVDGVLQNDYDTYTYNYTKIIDWVYNVRYPEVIKNKLSFIKIKQVKLEQISAIQSIYIWILKQELLSKLIGFITFMFEDEYIILFGYFNKPEEYYINIFNNILNNYTIKINQLVKCTNNKYINLTSIEINTIIHLVNGECYLLFDFINLLEDGKIKPQLEDMNRFNNILKNYLNQEQIKLLLIQINKTKELGIHKYLRLIYKQYGLFTDIYIVNKKTAQTILLFSIPNNVSTIHNYIVINSSVILKNIYDLWNREILLNKLAYLFYKELDKIPSVLLYCNILELHIDKKIWEMYSLTQKKNKLLQIFLLTN